MANSNLNFISIASAVALTLMLAACGSERTATPILEDPQGAIAAALAHPDRPTVDAADDASRKPAEVIAFTGIRPGMKVFEMEAGHGYYTEILSRIVGPEGELVMQNPAAFDSFAGAAVARRLGGDRLANVRHTKCDFDELKADDDSMDIVTWFLGPHELYFAPAGVDDLGDEKGAYAEAYRILKPGGYFVVLDHAAPAGSPKSTGGDTHRIDPAIVKTLAEQAGFELVEESDILRNPNDKYELSVFETEVRRKTDRFLLKFLKPA